MKVEHALRGIHASQEIFEAKQQPQPNSTGVVFLLINYLADVESSFTTRP